MLFLAEDNGEKKIVHSFNRQWSRGILAWITLLTRIICLKKVFCRLFTPGSNFHNFEAVFLCIFSFFVTKSLKEGRNITKSLIILHFGSIPLATKTTLNYKVGKKVEPWMKEVRWEAAPTDLILMAYQYWDLRKSL